MPQDQKSIVLEEKSLRKRSSSNGLKIVVPEPVFKKLDIQSVSCLIGKENALFVDVRDEDYEGGHIKGSIHQAFSSFDELCPSLVTLVEEKSTTSSLDTIVFYCMYSEQRSPQCATTFAEKVSGIKSLENVKIIILSGGFNAFLKKYPPPSEYIDEYDSKCYKEVDGQLLHKVDANYLDVITDKNVSVSE